MMSEESFICKESGLQFLSKPNHEAATAHMQQFHGRK